MDQILCPSIFFLFGSKLVFFLPSVGIPAYLLSWVEFTVLPGLRDPSDEILHLSPHTLKIILSFYPFGLGIC